MKKARIAGFSRINVALRRGVGLGVRRNGRDIQSFPCGRFCVLVAAAFQDTGQITCDGVTDVLDIILVANRWNCLLGAPCYLDRFDLNADDAITIADAMIVAGAWNAP